MQFRLPGFLLLAGQRRCGSGCYWHIQSLYGHSRARIEWYHGGHAERRYDLLSESISVTSLSQLGDELVEMVTASKS